jgi:hypothetical protein
MTRARGIADEIFEEAPVRCGLGATPRAGMMARVVGTLASSIPSTRGEGNLGYQF